MNNKIYIIRWWWTRKESVNIRIDNLFCSFSKENLVDIEIDYLPNNILLKIIVVLLLAIKSLFLVPRNSIVFCNVALIKASIPALLLKKLKNCYVIWDYDDTSFWNKLTINDFETIKNTNYNGNEYSTILSKRH